MNNKFNIYFVHWGRRKIGPYRQLLIYFKIVCYLFVGLLHFQDHSFFQNEINPVPGKLNKKVMLSLIERIVFSNYVLFYSSHSQEQFLLLFKMFSKDYKIKRVLGYKHTNLTMTT